ncbi:MAG: HIT family protein [Candidatus Altiarchaeales archaeon ex4484_2]|nr:MAG: HIT family protein [Candidatus Altiarchaeales archaeon ex4484_2]
MDERDCIFCRIVKGELPARKVYEDEDVIGLLDIQPFSRGHVLVIPKKHVVWFHEMSEELTGKVFKAANRISQKMKKAYDVEYIDLFARGMRIPHVHIFLIPTMKGEKNVFDMFVNMFSYVQENLTNPFSDEEMDEIAEKLRNA